jgi:hypothetical protein
MIQKRNEQNTRKLVGGLSGSLRRLTRILGDPGDPLVRRSLVIGIFVGILLGAGAVSAGVAEGNVSFDKSFENSTYTVETTPSDLDVSVSVGEDGVSIEPEEFGTTSVYVETGIGLNETTDLSTSVNLQMFPSSTNSEVYIGAFDEEFSVGSQTDRAKWGLAAKSASGESLVEIYEWGANSSEIVSEQKIGEYVDPPERVDLSIDFGSKYTEIQSDNGVIDANVTSPQFAYLAETTGIRASLKSDSVEFREEENYSLSGGSVSDIEYISATNEYAVLRSSNVEIYDGETGNQKTTINQGTHTDIAYSKRLNELAITEEGNDKVLFYDASTYSKTNEVSPGSDDARYIDYAPNGNIAMAIEEGGGAVSLAVYDASKSLSASNSNLGIPTKGIATTNDTVLTTIFGQGLYKIDAGTLGSKTKISSSEPKPLDISPNGYTLVEKNGDMLIRDGSNNLVETIKDVNDAELVNGTKIAAAETSGVSIYNLDGSVNRTTGASSHGQIEALSERGDYVAVESSNLRVYRTSDLAGESLRLAGLSGGFGGMGSIFPISGLPGSARAQMVGVVAIIGLIVWGWRD